jgi:hypothetical protein
VWGFLGGLPQSSVEIVGERIGLLYIGRDPMIENDGEEPSHVRIGEGKAMFGEEIEISKWMKAYTTND